MEELPQDSSWLRLTPKPLLLIAEQNSLKEKELRKPSPLSALAPPLLLQSASVVRDGTKGDTLVKMPGSGKLVSLLNFRTTSRQAIALLP